MVSEGPTSRIGRAQFPTRASASDQASNHARPAGTDLRPGVPARQEVEPLVATREAVGGQGGKGRRRRRGPQAHRLAPPQRVCRAAKCDPAARHTRFGRTAITNWNNDVSTLGPPAGPGHDESKRVRGPGKSSVRVVVCGAASSLASGHGGEPTPGAMPHQFKKESGLELSSPTSMTPAADRLTPPSQKRRLSSRSHPACLVVPRVPICLSLDLVGH